MADIAVNINKWRFPKAFWTANTVELFERAAFYSLFISQLINTMIDSFIQVSNNPNIIKADKPIYLCCGC